MMYVKDYNWEVKYSLLLPVRSEKLWSIISSPKNLELFHPFCKKNITRKWPGIDSIDEIHYYNGHLYTRNFVKWINNIGYDLLIVKSQEPKSFVRWRIEDLDDKSKLTITIYPYIFNTNSKWFDFLPFFLVIRPGLNNYLKNIGKGLLHHIKTNKKVTKNQFGNHKWFSK